MPISLSPSPPPPLHTHYLSLSLTHTMYRANKAPPLDRWQLPDTRDVRVLTDFCHEALGAFKMFRVQYAANIVGTAREALDRRCCDVVRYTPAAPPLILTPPPPLPFAQFAGALCRDYCACRQGRRAKGRREQGTTVSWSWQMVRIGFCCCRLFVETF